MEHLQSGHETTDAPVLPIVGAGIGLAVAAAVVCLIAYLTFRLLLANPAQPIANPSTAAQEPFPPAPRIEEHPAIEMKDLLGQENRQLSTYGWVDRKTGVIRIPVSRAIDLEL